MGVSFLFYLSIFLISIEKFRFLKCILYIFNGQITKGIDYADHCELIVGEPKNYKHRHIPISEEISVLLERIRGLDIKSDWVFSR